MKKSELLKLPIAPLEITEQIKAIPPKSKVNCINRKLPNYVYRACVKTVNRRKYLTVDLFDVFGKLQWRYFENRDGEYFRIKSDGKISTAGLDFAIVLDNWYSYYCRKFPADGSTDDVIKRFYDKRINAAASKITKTGLSLIAHFNAEKKKECREDRWEKERRTLRAAMKEIKPLGERVKKWAENDLMINSRYIFFENGKGKTAEGYCTHCKKTFNIPKPRHKAPGVCPKCKSAVTFLNRRLFKEGGISDSSKFTWLQETADGLCARYFDVNFIHRPNKLSSHIYFFEYKRTFFEYSKYFGWKAKKEWIYEDFHQEGREWQPSGGFWFNTIRIYPKGLNRLIFKTGMKARHTDYELIAGKCGNFNVDSFLNFPEQQVLAGHFANAGFYRLAGDIIDNRFRSGEHLDLKQKSVKKALGLPKEQVLELKAVDPGVYMAQFYVKNRPKYFFTAAEMKELFGMCSEYRGKDVEQLLKKMTLHRLLKYLKENSGAYEGSERGLFTDYVDYIQNAEKLGYDLKNDSVKFPKNFMYAHDQAAVNVKILEEKEGLKLFGRISKNEEKTNERYRFESREYIIRAPHDYRELVEEGVRLHHCVATYATKVATLETVILFIRQKKQPDKPYFTLNINPTDNIIIQCRGLGNCDYGKDIKKLLDYYKKAVLEDKTKKLKGA